ncbi:MAG TPA: hypothetical protein VIY49_40165 [Bryobacteraceae bacterium]
MAVNLVVQALWYLNIAASAVLFVRLYFQRLAGIYPFLIAYLLAQSIEQVLELALGRGRHLNTYARIYFAGQGVKVLLAILVVLELFYRALADKPALARFGRRMLAYTFSLAVGIGLVNLLLDAGAASGGYPILMRFLRLERSLDLVAFVLLIVMSGFLLWFPVRAHRNAVYWLAGFMIYSFFRWTGLLLTNLWPPKLWPQFNQNLNVVMLTVTLVCLTGWTLLLKPEGEKETVVTGHSWNPDQAERLTVQLNAINSRLARLARSS